jgi:hypothetical protein
VPSQNCVTARLVIEESFLRTQYLWLSPHISREVWGGGAQKIDGQHDTYRRSQMGSMLPTRPSLRQNRVFNHYNYFVTEKEKIYMCYWQFCTLGVGTFLNEVKIDCHLQ